MFNKGVHFVGEKNLDVIKMHGITIKKAISYLQEKRKHNLSYRSLVVC